MIRVINIFTAIIEPIAYKIRFPPCLQLWGLCWSLGESNDAYVRRPNTTKSSRWTQTGYGCLNTFGELRVFVVPYFRGWRQHWSTYDMVYVRFFDEDSASPMWSANLIFNPNFTSYPSSWSQHLPLQNHLWSLSAYPTPLCRNGIYIRHVYLRQPLKRYTVLGMHLANLF